MKKLFKKHLFNTFLIFTITLPWIIKPGIHSESATDNTTGIQSTTCYSGPEEPEEKSVIIQPSST